MFDNPTLQSIALIGAAALLIILFVLLALLLLWLSLVLLKRIQAELARAGVTPGQVDQALDGLATVPGFLRPLVDEPTDLAIILLASAFRRDPVTMVNHLDATLRALSKVTMLLPELRDALGLNEQVARQAAEGAGGDAAHQ